MVPANFVVSSLSDNGAGTLRDAITQANASPGTDTITATGVTGTISLLTALPTISGSVSITGAGPGSLTVRRDPGAATNFRIFNVDDGNGANLINVTFTGMTITGGVSDRGGGISCRLENLTLNRCVISNNSVTGVGGGLDVLTSNPIMATVVINDTTISGNTSGDNGGGSYVGDDGFFEINNSTVTGNSTQGTGVGAGLYFWGNNTPVPNRWVVRNTTIANNNAAGNGGGIGTLGPNNHLFVQNSTIVGNTSAGFGGGISMSAAGDDMTLDSSIISGNFATFNDISAAGGTVAAQNSQISDGTGFLNFIDNGGNQFNAHAALLLGPLQNNGGSTQTMLPGAGSPLIDAGFNAVIQGIDQRGFTRTAGTQVDIGAVETGGTGRPAGNIAGLPLNTSFGSAIFQVQVTYTDDTGINLASIGAGDLTISGPGAATVGTGVVTGGNGTTQVIATYPITAPGGTWDGPDNGFYTISSVLGGVTDTGSNQITAGIIGRFQVNVVGVTNTNDSGPGSLRQAILDSNASVGIVNVIGFAVGNGSITISPTTPLPAITDPTIIDGTTQPGYAGSPIVEIAGNAAGAGAIGLEVSAAGSTVRGLVLNRWGTGLVIANTGVTVQGNYIGTNVAGTAASANGIGLFVAGASGALIGSDLDGTNDAAERNIISGNTQAGVRGGGATSILRYAQWTSGPGANNHYYLRASVNASWAQAEAFSVAFGGHLVSIGSAEENAFVASNLGAGWIGFTDDEAYGGQEFGNTSGAANRGEGWVWTDGTPAPYPIGGPLTGFMSWNGGEPNDAGNEDYAEIQSTGGWNDLSTQTLPGIAEFTSPPNLAAILGALGGGSPNRIQGNYIGTNAAGTGAVANGTGLDLGGALGDTVRGNVISGNTGAGLTVSSNAVAGPNGHYYVTSPTAQTWTAAEAFAVANGGHLVSIGSATENAIVVGLGNGWIGFTDDAAYGGTEFGNTSGTANRGEGWVWTDGTPAPYPVGGPASGYQNWNAGEPNNAGTENFAQMTGGGGWNDLPASSVLPGVIELLAPPSASLLGVGLRTAGGLSITGNIIGRNAANSGALANGGAGISVADNSIVTIGGTGAGAGNTIQNNTGPGVAVTGTNTGNVSIRGNSISGNGGLGIDLGTAGVTANDAGDPDAGPNGLQNFPVLTSAASGATTTVSGTFNGIANSAFTLDFYANAAGDPTGNGEGQRYLGSTVVNTNGSGNATFTNVVIAAASAGGEIISATATDAGGNTSEFAANVTATGGGVAPTVTATSVNAGAVQRSRVTTIDVTFSAQVTFAGTVAQAFTLTRNGGGAVNFTATANVVGGVTVVTLNAFSGAETDSASLRDGRYTLTALANQISVGGTNMASNFTFGDPQGLFRFYGDMDANRRIDIADFGFFSLAYLQSANYNAALDFNADGRIDIADFGQFSVRYFTTLP